MKMTTKVRLTAFGCWLALVGLTRYGGWYENEMPADMPSMVPSWPVTLIGSTVIMVVCLRLRKLYWRRLMEMMDK